MTKDTERCENCGMTKEEFLMSETFGCAYCYETFIWEARALLRKIHGRPEHTGKTPFIPGTRQEEEYADNKEIDIDVIAVSEDTEETNNEPAGAEDVKAEEIRSKAQLMAELASKMADAASREDYESARSFRDQLNALAREDKEEPRG